MRSGEAFFQKVAASLIIPITFLPLAAVLLAVGNQLHIGPVAAAGLALISSWLPLFYGIGISIGFTDGDAVGALSVAAGFTVMVSVAEAVSGDPTINLGVLGGVVAGAVCTWLYNRVKAVGLPEYLALFSGKRMGPIVSALAGVVLGYLFGIAWPPIHSGTLLLGRWIYESGGLGVFVYGAALRLLIPTGLHHILMQLVDNQLGGWIDPATGKMVAGEALRFLAGDPSAGRILSGFFLTLGFGPIGAALAITHEARPEQRRKVAGLMTTGALTAALLGITEPVEFAYIFASPVLLGLHVLFSGLASLVAYQLNIHLGGYALPMILINWHLQQNGWLLLPLGLAWIALYYVSFRAVIRWQHPAILGQVPEADRASVEAEAAMPDGEGAAYLQALGGTANILGLDACMTRLRLVLVDPGGMDEPELERLGALRVLKGPKGEVQVVVGARAGEVEGRIRTAMGKGPASTTAAGRAPGTAHKAGSINAGGPRVVTLLSPLTGRVLSLDAVPDPVFAGRIAGDGLAIEASEGILVAPAQGTVGHVFPGGHAIGFVTPEGLELIVHVGIDTVSLKGEAFSIHAANGSAVGAGEEMGRFDTGIIASRGLSLISPILLTNLDIVKSWKVLAEGVVTAGSPLLRVELKG